MAEQDFSLPLSSWTELRKMIDAYYRADRRAGGEAVLVPDVAQHAAMDKTWISRNNKFFQSLGLITGKSKKSVTDTGRALGLAISHDDEEQIRDQLARVVHNSDFLSRVINAVSVRGGMDTASLQRHIAISAEAPKTQASTTGARAVIQMLTDAGVVVDEGGTYRASAIDPPPDVVKESSADADSISIGASEGVIPGGIESRVRPVLRSPQFYGGGAVIANVPPAPVGPGVTVNVNFTVDSSNLDAVRELLRELGALPPEVHPDADADES